MAAHFPELSEDELFSLLSLKEKSLKSDKNCCQYFSSIKKQIKSTKMMQ
jgi:hypothetical protein